MTARLLAFSRQQPLEPNVIEPNKLVTATSELLRRTLGEHIQVETVLAGGLWRSRVDRAELENALVNICVNGRDAMPAGGKLTIETANSHLDQAYARANMGVKPGQYVLTSVTDTGSGMTAWSRKRSLNLSTPPKALAKEPAWALAKSTDSSNSLRATSKFYTEIGHGTTVRLYLPRYFGGVADAASRQDNVLALPRLRPSEVVLVVEDETSVRHTTAAMLRDIGYTVVQAANGTEALEQLEFQPSISLMLTDIVMPEMNGRQLAEAFARQRPGLPVLFTTGYTRNSIVHNGALDPGVALLSKPFTQNQLARKVRAVIDGKDG